MFKCGFDFGKWYFDNDYGQTLFLDGMVLLFFHLPWLLINWTLFHSTRTFSKVGKSNESESDNESSLKLLSHTAGSWPDIFCIIWTLSIFSIFGLFRQFLYCPNSFWIVRRVSRLSGEFLNCAASFWVVRKFFWMIRTVSILSGQFLYCPDSFWIVRTLFGLSG